MHIYQQRKLDHGFGVFKVPGTGMSIDSYIRWMLVFSVPFIVFSFFILYRLIIRLKHGDVHPVNDQETMVRYERNSVACPCNVWSRPPSHAGQCPVHVAITNKALTSRRAE